MARIVVNDDRLHRLQARQYFFENDFIERIIKIGDYGRLELVEVLNGSIANDDVRFSAKHMLEVFASNSSKQTIIFYPNNLRLNSCLIHFLLPHEQYLSLPATDSTNV